MIRGYRVWDNQEKTYSDKAFSIDQLGVCYIQDEDGYWGEIDDSRFIVEFETGLKDKNGKEIYEGDIVNVDGQRCVMRAFVRPALIESGFALFDSQIRQIELQERSADTAEIIGNIHENPELLGGEK